MKSVGIPRGTRDFSPIEVNRRNYIFETIKSVFKKFGFEALETPAMEKLSTLLGKYGDEGDKLLFRVLNSGNFLKKITDKELDERDTRILADLVAEKGLRYDLTVPFARYVVQHQNELQFPFKRYQMQAVWRADRPQKGRYREFFQCDADIIGSNSLINELEIVQIADEIFNLLDINVEIKINNRKILAGIAEFIGYPDSLTDITVAIDKIDKIGVKKVCEELYSRGISEKAVSDLEPVLYFSGKNDDTFDFLSDILKESESGMKGIEEMTTLFNYLKAFKLKNEVVFDIRLARGLSYYTGAIFEVVSKDFSIGSISGGGRYDDLTGIFGLKDMSGVGISFGADRIYDVLLHTNKFPEKVTETSKVLFVNFGEEEEKYCLKILAEIRKAGISAEIFPDKAKMKKQMTYADKKNIPYVILAGENEILNNKLTVKDMQKGEQSLIDSDKIVEFLLK